MNPSSPLALSTCWATKQAEGADQILGLLEQTGFSHFELEYRILHKEWGDLIAGFKALGFGISSLHNFLPLPPEFPPEKASGDLFNLAAADKEERATAVKYSGISLERASDLEAPVLVMHLGWVEGALDRQVIKKAADEEEITPELAGHLQQIEQKAGRALDAVSFSLERLVKRAEPLGVKLGLENRYHPGQVPNLPQCRLLLERFSGAPIGHWHDLGHSRVQQRAGLEGPDAWLHALGDNLLGCHLHDSTGHEDHKLPGRGDEDWDQVAALFATAPVKVLELHPGPNAKEMAAAGEMLARAFQAAEKDMA